MLSCPTLCDPMDCHTPAFLYFTISWSLLKLLSIEPMMPFNYLILCHTVLFLNISSSVTLFSSRPQSFPASGNELALLIRWPKYWSFSFSISPSNEYSGLIYFGMDRLDLLTVQETLQHHSSKASILQPSAFFVLQLSHPYMTTGKTIALTRQIFVGKVKNVHTDTFFS